MNNSDEIYLKSQKSSANILRKVFSRSKKENCSCNYFQNIQKSNKSFENTSLSLSVR